MTRFALLFDLDGTLADPFVAFKSSIYHACEVYEIKPPDVSTIKTCIGPPLHLSLPGMLGISDEKLLAEILKTFRAHHVDKALFDYEFFPEARRTLESLSKKFSLFLATSKPISQAEIVMHHFDYHRYFQTLYGSELTGALSDKRELIAHILRHEKIDPHNALMIGDRKFDVIGAKANSVRSAGVMWGYGSKEEFEAAGADYICENFSDLESLCFSLGKPY